MKTDSQRLAAMNHIPFVKVDSPCFHFFENLSVTKNVCQNVKMDVYLALDTIGATFTSFLFACIIFSTIEKNN